MSAVVEPLTPWGTVPLLHDLMAAIDTDAEVSEVTVGAFFTAVKARECGLASTLRGTSRERRGFPVERAGDLLPTGGLELAHLALSGSELEASVGMAALNALLEIDRRRLTTRNATTLVVQRAAGKRVAVIGHFPFVPLLRDRARELWVLERRHPADRSELSFNELMRRLGEADLCVISGTTITNHSISQILATLRPSCFKIMLGPTTPLSPVLFDYGLDVLSGVVVLDPPRTMRSVVQGSTFRQIRGLKLVSMFR